jgi:hypothetical protein
MKIGVREIHLKPLVLSTQDLAMVNRIRKIVSQVFAEAVIVSSKKMDWLAGLKALLCRRDCSPHTMDVARESQDQLQWISCATGLSADYLPQLCLDGSGDEKRLSETSSSFAINAPQHRADQQKLSASAKAAVVTPQGTDAKEHALTAAHKVDEILAECSQRLRENDGHDQDSEADLSHRWLSDIVRYLGEHGGSQGVTISSLGGKAPRPVELKVKLGRLLVSEEAVRAGVSVTGTSPSSVVSLKQPQHELQRILMDILRISGGEMSASDLCSKLYQQSHVARDHVREQYGSFKAFLTTSALKDEVDFVQDQGCGKVVLKTQAKAFKGTDGKAAPAPAQAAAKVSAVTPRGTDANTDKNGPHKVFLRHTSSD